MVKHTDDPLAGSLYEASLRLDISNAEYDRLCEQAFRERDALCAVILGKERWAKAVEPTDGLGAVGCADGYNTIARLARDEVRAIRDGADG